MKVMIRCNYCKKEVPYYGKLYKIERKTSLNSILLAEDHYRYCSKECAKKQILKELNNNVYNNSYIIQDIVEVNNA